MTAGIDHPDSTARNRVGQVIAATLNATTEGEIARGIMGPRQAPIIEVEAPNTPMAGARGIRVLPSAHHAIIQTLFLLFGLVHLLVQLVRPKRIQRLLQKNELRAWPL